MITHDFQGCRFECYTRDEFTEAGMKKTHHQVSNAFTPGEGPLLQRWVKQFGGGAVLVSNGKAAPRITVFAPKKARKRQERRKKYCGAGAGHLEGLTGNIDDHWAFYDVLDACTKKLRQWEEDGVMAAEPDIFNRSYARPGFSFTVQHVFPGQYF